MKKARKFWNWKTVKNEAGEVRTLFLNGVLAEESWYDDDITPEMFRNELNAGKGDIEVWINSPGGDCIAAAQIYNMLQAYKGNVTVKIDGIAASAASVIAMAGRTVLMSPTSVMMIHNPFTMAIGDTSEMQKAIQMLDEIKESIINAYELKTGLSRTKISHLMDAETWFSANKAVEMGFADDVMFQNKDKSLPEEEDEPEKDQETEEEQEDDEPKKKENASFSYSSRHMEDSLISKLKEHTQEKATGVPVDQLMKRLNLIKKS